jgi:hypothetical protein
LKDILGSIFSQTAELLSSSELRLAVTIDGAAGRSHTSEDYETIFNIFLFPGKRQSSLLHATPKYITSVNHPNWFNRPPILDRSRNVK